MHEKYLITNTYKYIEILLRKKNLLVGITWRSKRLISHNSSKNDAFVWEICGKEIKNDKDFGYF